MSRGKKAAESNTRPELFLFLFWCLSDVVSVPRLKSGDLLLPPLCRWTDERRSIMADKGVVEILLDNWGIRAYGGIKLENRVCGCLSLA